MRSIARRLLAADQAQETRVFVLMAAFGLAIGAVYWFVSYEPAGTVMLVAFGLATAVIGFRLARDPASRAIRRRLSDGDSRRAQTPREDATDVAGGGTAGIDRPFLDELGRLPDASIAPFAVGLGAAVAATGLVFGPAPVLVGLLPFLWGATTWLTAAGEELRATDHDGPDE